MEAFFYIFCIAFVIMMLVAVYKGVTGTPTKNKLTGNRPGNRDAIDQWNIMDQSTADQQRIQNQIGIDQQYILSQIAIDRQDIQSQSTVDQQDTQSQSTFDQQDTSSQSSQTTID